MEVTCKYCKEKIEKENAYKPIDISKSYFCNEEHYKLYSEEKLSKKSHCTQKNSKLNDKEKQEYKNLTDYIQLLHSPYDVNWNLWTSQIKNACKEYSLTYKDIRGIITYAKKYDMNFVFDSEYGLGQFIPKYIQPFFDFRELTERNAKIAETFEIPEPIKIKRTQQRKRYIPRGEAEDDAL